MPLADIRPADINQRTTALAAKPDARHKLGTVPVSAATVNAHLRVLKALLNWAAAHGYLDSRARHRHPPRPAHSGMVPHPEDFWTVLDHVDTAHGAALHDPFVVAAHLGLRINGLAAPQRGDVDLTHERVQVRHNFDEKRRAVHGEIRGQGDLDAAHPEA
jgi:hypothetical protein